MNNIFIGFIPSCIGFWFIGKDLVTLAPLISLLTLYVTYNVVTGIKEVEEYHQTNLQKLYAMIPPTMTNYGGEI